MEYILVMSLSGSLLLACCLLLERISAKPLSQSAQYMLLKVALFYFAVPLAPLGKFYREIASKLPIRKILEVQNGRIEFKEFVHEGSSYLNTAYMKILLITGIWLMVCLCILAVKLVRYQRARRKILSVSNCCLEEADLALLKELKARHGIKRQVRLYYCKEVVIPFTIGIFVPAIFMQDTKDAVHKRLILEHELVHIKRNDMFVKMLQEFVCCVHWFNPLVYLLKNKINQIAELSCDERVVEDMSDTGRSVYAHLIVANMKQGHLPSKICNALSQDGEAAKERVMVIMRSKKRTRAGKLLAAALVLTLGLLNSLTVLAYPQATTITLGEDMAATGDWGFQEGGDTVFLSEEMQGIYDTESLILLYEKQFVDEAGNIYPVEEGITPQSICSHSYVNGTYQDHVKNSDGGCTVYIYNAKRCKYCGAIVINSLNSTTIYTVCPH